MLAQLFQIIESRLQVAYNLGEDNYFVPLSNVQASDGQWHKVVMERFGKEFIVKLDSGEGRYYAETAGPIGGAVDFIASQDQVHAGGSVVYDGASQPSYSGAQEDDFQSCKCIAGFCLYPHEKWMDLALHLSVTE